MMEEKLIIPKAGETENSGFVVRISRKAYLMLTDIVKQSGQSKSFIASRMIEFAFDHTEVNGGEEDGTDT